MRKLFRKLGIKKNTKRHYNQELEAYIAENYVPENFILGNSIPDVSKEKAAAVKYCEPPSVPVMAMPRVELNSDKLCEAMPYVSAKECALDELCENNLTDDEPNSEIRCESELNVDEQSDIEILEQKLSARLEHLSDTFSQYLLYLIQAKGLNNADVYKRAAVDKKTFSKIKNNADYHPQKLTALCLCVGARLNLDETKDLLARAGYALSPCDMTDIIFSFFIENRHYDVIDIDIQLEEHGLPCIIS